MFTVFNTLRRFGLCGPEPDQVNEQYQPQLANPIYSQQSSSYPYIKNRGLIEVNPNHRTQEPISTSHPLGSVARMEQTRERNRMIEIQKGAKQHLANQDLTLSSSQKELSKDVDRAIRVKKVSKKTSKKANKVGQRN